MKKLIKYSFLIVALFLAITTSGQQAVKVYNSTTVATANPVQAPSYVYFWGTTSDTLTASSTITQVMRIKGDGLVQIKFQMDMTKISGTVTNNMIISSSLDGVTWTARDTIAYSNASTGVSLSVDPDFTNWNWPWMKVSSTAPATAQKAWYKGWMIVRY